MLSKKNKKPASHRLYERYAYLAEVYANKLFNTNAIGMDREDVVQELRLKIITSIRAYGKRWRDFKKNGLYKPVPIKYYIQTAMNNKLIDMVEEIKRDVNHHSLSMQDHSFDYGVDSSGFSVLNLTGSNKEAIVYGVDLLQGLEGQQKDVFCMYLKGHPLKTIEKIYKGKLKPMPCLCTEKPGLHVSCNICGGSRFISNVGAVIRVQVEHLKEHKELIYGKAQQVHYSYQLSEDD